MKNRNPNLSFILSFVFSGLGQVYNGELKKGIMFLVLIIPLYILLGLTGLLSSFTGLIVITSLILVYKLAVAYEAYRKSNSLNPYEIKPINQISKYLLFIVFGFAINWIGVSLGRTIIGYEAFEIPTPSMEPSVIVGDKIMATKIKPEEIEIGDIITFTKDDGQKYLSRAVGLPGQTIEVKDDKVIIDGESEIWNKTVKTTSGEYEYQKFKSELPNGKQIGTQKMLKFRNNNIPSQEISNKKIITIPENQIYVLGDNRNNSMDSRMYGNVEFENIDKQVQYIWWSNDKSRIGKNLSQ